MPFNIPSTNSGYWLLALLFIWAALLFGGFIFGRTDATKEGRTPTWARIGSSVILVVAAWSWYLFSLNGGVGVYSLLIAIGMTLGCIGDLFMAELLPMRDHVMGGIASFGVGHIAYIAAILIFSNQQGLDAPGPRYGAWVVWLVLGLVLWYLVVFRGRKATVLHWAALPYSLLLASTTGFATGLAWQAPAFIGLAVGAALFLASDLILAAQLFNKLHFPLIRDVVWLTYGPGQMLIVFSVGSALQLL
jgi:phosphoglycerol transferase MdoB-like AlkP superfamily enzyme